MPLTLRLGDGLVFLMSIPELKPNKITNDEDKNKSRIEFRLPKPLLIANKKMRIYSSASIAANPMFKLERRSWLLIAYSKGAVAPCKASVNKQ